ncbi:MAG: hypothetical protein ACUZ8H_14135 [Candidatus Anammoxibacter sp.]
MFGMSDADYVDFELSQVDDEYETWLEDVSSQNNEELDGMLCDMDQQAA